MSKEQILIDVLKLIFNRSEATGQEGCTWGDTQYDSASAAAGFNECLSLIKDDVEKYISQSQQESQPSFKVLNVVKGGDDYTNGVFDYIIMLNKKISTEHLKEVIAGSNHRLPIPSPESDAVELLKRIAKDYILNDGLFYHNDDEDGDGPLLPEQLYNQLKSQKQ